ncbi:MAG: hypothetical protein LUD07_00795 [Clostridiales bacterium]|nr:hypothetical protein [Clostridiales bacterium]
MAIIKKGSATGFDTSINRLQAQGYVIISNFVYLQDRHGKEYGWGVAEYSTSCFNSLIVGSFCW